MDEAYDTLLEADEETETAIMRQIYDEIGAEYASAVPPRDMHKETIVGTAACRRGQDRGHRGGRERVY